MIYHGTSKCIVYCKDTKDLKKIKKLLKKLTKYYCHELWIDSITSKDNHKIRDEKIEEFKKNKKCVLLSIKILDECVDISICDSIYITNPTENKVRTIQRMNRCTRKDANNPNKIGHIYMWCDEYKSILETLSSLKEYDIDYHTKLSVQRTTLNRIKNEKDIVKDEESIKKYIIGIKEFRIKKME
jgi:superfamily II DNA or RNA helicase